MSAEHPLRRWSRRSGFGALIALALIFSGCRSEAIRYHTLLPPFSGKTEPDANAVIQALSVPAQVDRAQIVLREGDSSLRILEADWWGATLAEEMKNALTDQLGQRNGNTPPALVRVEVRRFDAVPGRYALIDTLWRVGGNGGDTPAPLTCTALLQTDAGVSVDALVAAQQRNIAQLAARIAASARNWRSGGGCP